MVLNNQTFQKVLELFPNMPYNTATYCGCCGANSVSFLVGTTDENNNVIAGVNAVITEDFKIKSVKRLTTTYSTGLKKNPVKKEFIPLHPLGTIPNIYKY